MLMESKRHLYETVIGIEVHVQLTTRTKIFCSCANRTNQDPNTDICPICTGYPGVLPVLNRQVIEYGLAAALATNSTIPSRSRFDRKHYFYPDLPKGYQITQQYEPICIKGYVPIRLEDGTTKKIRLTRIHIEEDAGKNIHSAESGESFVDLNRAGTPLLEIVSEPDLSSSYEARAYLKMLRSMVQYLGICSGNMQEGAFRADTNISIRKKGEMHLGTKCELKNINSFKFIGDAIEYEIDRQISILEAHGTIRQETRLWNSVEKRTETMRVKEEAADYRYFNDPDLPTIDIDTVQLEQVKKGMPELPFEKFDRYCTKLGLSPYEADILVEEPILSSYFERAYALAPSKHIINWILRDVLGYLKEHKLDLATFLVTPEKLAHIIQLLEKGTVNANSAKELFILVAQTGDDPGELLKKHGLEQMGSSDELEAIIKEIIAQNRQAVADYKAGNEKLFGFFVGQAMKKTQGKGNPKLIGELLKKYL
jgi:aspartyl-tRNA(Asn)/glutamyl-tRNA(Gln) amidotransferase subunit B